MNLKVRLFRKRKRGLYRLIDAIRFFGHVLSRELVGPCATTSADLSKLTSSAFSLITIGIPEVLEDFGRFPDLPKMFFPDISTIQF
jgi:hypothetical protein